MLRRSVTSVARRRACNPCSLRLSSSQSENTDPVNAAKKVDPEQLLKLYGLGSQKNPAAAFRDLKLEARVAALFQQTLQLGEAGTASLHPEDLKAQERAKEAQERIIRRLHELDEKHAAAFEAILTSIVAEKARPNIERERKTTAEGVIPGKPFFF